MTATGVPLAPGCRPVLGHVAQFLRRPLPFLESLPDVGDLVEVRLGPMRMYMACSPELTWQVLTNDRVFDKGGTLFGQIRQIAGNGLITCMHRDHRRQRRLAQPAFHAKRIAAYGAMMATQVEQMVGSWQDGQIVDVPTEMVALTSNTVVETVFSSSLTPETRGQVAGNLTEIMRSLLRRTVSPAALNKVPTPGNLRFARACRELRTRTVGVIAERRREQNDVGDLLSALIEANDEESRDALSHFADEEIVDQFVTFFVAGSETTASALSWSLYLLARHPEVQEQLQAEVDAVLGGRNPTTDDVPRLGLIGRTITESLRMYPPAALFFTREVTAPVRLGEHDLPAGATVAYSSYLIHHRADLYPDPHRFDLDRTYPRQGFVPFAAGARKCIGDNYAMAEATIALAAILSRGQVETVPGEEVVPAHAISLRPRHLFLRFTERTPAPPVPRAAPGGVPSEVACAEATAGSAPAPGRGEWR
ncbi:cytochrome P450 [Pseudonocardia sp. TRM90224]|uniref:cytochrome P450 n=1 Tax=Pseudonocardia sp. TRM90224 TaxID=2812678 RepID=UPI001E4D7814|nr:cytochrome P450 [Pseudonocardia sp. TRM90224]